MPSARPWRRGGRALRRRTARRCEHIGEPTEEAEVAAAAIHHLVELVRPRPPGPASRPSPSRPGRREPGADDGPAVVRKRWGPRRRSSRAGHWPVTSRVPRSVVTGLSPRARGRCARRRRAWTARGVVVGVAQPDPGVGHVAGLDGLGGGAEVGKVGVDDPFAVAPVDLLEAAVAADVPVVVGAQRDDAGGVLRASSGAPAPRARWRAPTRGRRRRRWRRSRDPTRRRPGAGSRSRRTASPSGRRTTPCGSPTWRCRVPRSPGCPSSRTSA